MTTDGGLTSISLQDMRNRISTYSSRFESPVNQNGYKRAAVLALLVWHDDQWEVVFTRRTDRVQSHKGQISFPGGMEEIGDQSIEATALRETNEEIGLSVSSIEILGRLPVIRTVTGFDITPVVGWTNSPLHLRLNSEEVEKVFCVPLSWLANPSNWAERLYTRSNGTQEPVIFYESYADEILWGATAKMVWHLLQALQMP